jgi:hypothetical protein
MRSESSLILVASTFLSLTVPLAEMDASMLRMDCDSSKKKEHLEVLCQLLLLFVLKIRYSDCRQQRGGSVAYLCCDDDEAVLFVFL